MKLQGLFLLVWELHIYYLCAEHRRKTEQEAERIIIVLNIFLRRKLWNLSVKVLPLQTHLGKELENQILYNNMANHKSALKRIRSNEAKRLRNRYQAKTTRTFIKKLKGTTEQAEAQELYKTVSSMLDRLAKKNIIHKNKAANNKSKLAKFVNSLAA